MNDFPTCTLCTDYDQTPCRIDVEAGRLILLDAPYALFDAIGGDRADAFIREVNNYLSDFGMANPFEVKQSSMSIDWWLV